MKGIGHKSTKPRTVLPFMSFEEADKLVQRTGYAMDAIEFDRSKINWGDAMMFFWEGYQHACRVLASIDTAGSEEVKR